MLLQGSGSARTAATADPNNSLWGSERAWAGGHRIFPLVGAGARARLTVVILYLVNRVCSGF